MARSQIEAIGHLDFNSPKIVILDNPVSSITYQGCKVGDNSNKCRRKRRFKGIPSELFETKIARDTAGGTDYMSVMKPHLKITMSCFNVYICYIPLLHDHVCVM